MTTQSQANCILRALKNGESLTQLDAFHRFGCFRLAARIADLRAAGHAIKTTNEKHEGGTHARYSLAVKEASSCAST